MRLFPVLAMLLMPFVVTTTGAGRAIGWATGIGILFWRRDGLASHSWWVLTAAAWMVAAVVGPDWFRGSAYHIGMVALSGVGFVLIALYSPSRSRLLLVIASVVSLSALAWAVNHLPAGYLDVAVMHRAAGNALRAGDSPWTGLEVSSGAPGAEGSTIDGDPYPPATLVWYSVADWITNDPRAGGAAAWALLVLASVTGRWADRRPLILVVTSAALPLLLWTGWTEFLTTALLALCVGLWHSPAFSSAILGIALATKQYMVVLGPLLLARAWPQSALRRLAPLAIAAGLALVGFTLGERYLHAIIGVYSEFEARTDSASLFGALSSVGVDTPVPAWLGPLAGMSWAVYATASGRIRDVGSFLREGARSLTILLLAGTQAFSNYWFLVFTMLMLAGGAEDGEGDGGAAIGPRRLSPSAPA